MIRDPTGLSSALANLLIRDEKAYRLLSEASDFTGCAAYAEQAGKLMATVLDPLHGALDGMSYDEAIELIRPVLETGYDSVADLTVKIQEALNRQADITLAAIRPTLDASRVTHLVEKLTEEGEGAEWLLGDDVLGNIARSAVQDTIEENAKFQKEAGLHSYIERIGHGCCKWCTSMSGRFEYGEQPYDFFRVHKDCTCRIEFHPAKNKAQRITYTTDADGNRHKITTDMP